VIYTDAGTTENHLIDLLVLIVVLVGLLWESRGAWQGLADGLQALLLIVAFWGLASQSVRALGLETRALVTGAGNLRSGPYRPLAKLVGEGPLFSEHPFVPVARGQAPVLLDPYAFVILARKHPDWAEDLIRRIHAQEFRHVVLVRRVDDPSADASILLGPTLLQAINDAYRLKGQAEGYFVYVPRD
jgi:hypothetical protein